MDNKQKEQMKKGLVFGGLGLLFALSMWFIFAPSGKDKTAAEQGLNDSIPQATTEKLTENKLKAYELGDKAHEEEQTREEMGRLSDYPSAFPWGWVVFPSLEEGKTALSSKASRADR